MKVTLLTSSGQFAGEADLGNMQVMPDVVSWGARAFTRHPSHEMSYAYVEAFTIDVGNGAVREAG